MVPAVRMFAERQKRMSTVTTRQGSPPRRGLLREWRNAKYRTSAGAIFCPNLSTRGLDYLARNRQTKPCAVQLARIKRIENLVELVGGNTGSRVDDIELEGGTICQRGLHRHPAVARSAILHGIESIHGKI